MPASDTTCTNTDTLVLDGVEETKGSAAAEEPTAGVR